MKRYWRATLRVFTHQPMNGKGPLYPSNERNSSKKRKEQIEGKTEEIIGMHGYHSQWPFVATLVVRRRGSKTSGWTFKSHPGPHSWVLLERSFGSVCLYFARLFGSVLFFGGDIHARCLFSQQRFRHRCAPLVFSLTIPPLYPTSFPSTPPFFGSDFLFFLILLSVSVRLRSWKKEEECVNLPQVEEALRGSCSALVSWFAFVVVVVVFLLLCLRFSASWFANPFVCCSVSEASSSAADII